MRGTTVRIILNHYVSNVIAESRQRKVDDGEGGIKSLESFLVRAGGEHYANISKITFFPQEGK